MGVLDESKSVNSIINTDAQFEHSLCEVHKSYHDDQLLTSCFERKL